MPRHDRAHGAWHSKRQKAGNRRRIRAHDKTRRKAYATGPTHTPERTDAEPADG